MLKSTRATTRERFLLVTIAVFLVLSFPALISQARADGCQVAAARYNAANKAAARAFVAAFQKIFGTTPVAYFTAHPGDRDPPVKAASCLKYEPVLQARLSGVEALEPLWNALNACAGRRAHADLKGIRPSLNSPAELAAEIKRFIGGCDAIIVAATGGTSASPSSDKAAPPGAPPNHAAQPDQVAKSTPQQPPPRASESGASKPLPVQTNEKAAVATDNATCNGEVTSNSCITTPPVPSNNPTSVTIGNKPIPSPAPASANNNSGGNRNVPTPCQDLSGPLGCQGAGGVVQAPTQRTETDTSTNEAPGPLEQLEKRSGEIYLPNMQPPPMATSPSVSTGTATTTNPAPSPASPTASTTGTGTPNSPSPQQPPSDVQNCTQGATFYVAVVINPERAKLGQYTLTNACKTREVKAQLKTYDVEGKASTGPVQVPASGSEQINSYTGKAPEVMSACFVGESGC